jgi:hypothetical protein
MPESHFNDPNYYRNWAEEIRTLSGAMKAAKPAQR